MNPEGFDQLVEEALAEIPDQFRKYLEEVSFVIQDRLHPEQRRDFGFEAGDRDPLGFYDGIPLGERSSFDGLIPHRDTIYIFREPLIALCEGREEEMREEIRITVIHEIAHHFGMDEDEVDDLGYG